MAYQFVEKHKATQEEMAYIAYMIVGSYFHKEVCRNSVMPNRLFLYYTDMSEKAQETKERIMISEADRELRVVEDDLAVMNCESVIRFVDGKYVLDFFTGFESVHVEVDVKGKCSIEIR